MIPLIKNMALIALLVLGVFVFLSIWKISVTPLLASAGIAGVVVALAAKDTLANFFGGISIFVDRPFKIGDYIVLDEKDRGEVVTIGIRSTRIKTRDDILITIPNAIIANTKIVNESAPIPKFRIRIPVGVAYGSDIDLVQDTLLSIAVENSNVVEDSETRVRFRTFGDSSLNFELLCWVTEPAIRGLTIHELNTAIYKKFIEAGITIPFPPPYLHLFRQNIG
jgi:small-conductance mechanosensitive channel